MTTLAPAQDGAVEVLDFRVMHIVSRWRLRYAVDPVEVALVVPNATYSLAQPAQCTLWVPHPDVNAVIKARIQTSGLVLMSCAGEAAHSPVVAATAMASWLDAYYPAATASASPVPQPRVKDFVTLWVTARARTPSRLRIAAFFQAFPDAVDYDPERHSAAVYHVDAPRATVTIFPSGRMFIVRAEDAAAAEEVARVVAERLRPFYRKRGPRIAAELHVEEKADLTYDDEGAW